MMTKEHLANAGRENCQYRQDVVNNSFWQCSECQLDLSFEGDSPFNSYVYYCPRCGRYVEAIVESDFDLDEFEHVGRTITRKEWEARK